MRGVERRQQPCILVKRTPANEAEAPPWLQCSTNIRECRHGITEKHDAEAGERCVEDGAAEIAALRVDLAELRPQPGARYRSMPRHVEHWRGDIDAHYGAFLAHAACKVQRRLPAPAADIDDRFPFCWRERSQCLKTQGCYLAIQLFLILRPGFPRGSVPILNLSCIDG